MNTTYKDLIQQTFDFPQEEFHTENNNLFFHNINLKELIEQYGSPLKFSYLPKISENIIIKPSIIIVIVLKALILNMF